MVGGVNYTSDQWWAVSITPLASGGRCQLHLWPVVGGVNFTSDQWWAVAMTLLSLQDDEIFRQHFLKGFEAKKLFNACSGLFFTHRTSYLKMLEFC
jgi:hypothetical protein